MTKWLKTILPWLIIGVGLATIVYPRVTGTPLFPVFNYDNPATTDYNELMDYAFWQAPFVYIFSYITRAWGPPAFAFVLGGVLSAFVLKETMKKYLSSRHFHSFVLAGVLAPVLTVCSCAMIPIFGGLLLSGAGIGPALTFLPMAPAANIMALIFTATIISERIMLFRLAFSLVGAIAIGYLTSRTRRGKEQEKKYASITAVSVEEVKFDFNEKSWNAMKEAGILAKLVLPYLGAGLFIISFIERYLPTQLVVNYLSGTSGVALGAAIGVPTYTPTLVEVFLVKGLINKGMSPAAALAFLIGAPMASIPSMLAVSRIIGWKVVVNYALLAIVVAFIAGVPDFHRHTLRK
ncbi:MAG: permease [Chloroflexi bacterium]|nr:permease [Chloroflexota bacterium]